jgi:serine protease
VAGVAYGARIMPLRALAEDGGTSYDINQAVRYAAGLPNDSGTTPSQPATVINMSLGGPSPSQIDQDLFNDLRERGVIVVAAAGNEGSTRPSYPAAYDGVFSVSAVDAQGRITSYSNRGSSIDLAAPGGDGSNDFTGDGYPDGVLSTGASPSGFAYTFLSGTSMAAPHVAGVFALMKAANPGLTPADLERLLSDGALTDDRGPAGRDNDYGYGLINAEKAVTTALAVIGESPATRPALTSSASVLNFGNTLGELTFSLSASGNGDIGSVTVESSVDWLTLRAVNVDAEGVGQYQARVDRGQLPDGIYSGLIVATSAVNQIEIEALITVGTLADADVGLVYVLLYDPVTDTVVDQALARPGRDGYRFQFPSAPVGRYQVAAGTDLDNDLFICDAGEACGAYLTIDQPLLLDIDSDRTDIDIPIEYLVAIPTPSTARATGSITLPRKTDN